MGIKGVKKRIICPSLCGGSGGRREGGGIRIPASGEGTNR